MFTDAIIIFLKYPELGRSKTRLAATVGDKNALKIYEALLNHTRFITKNLKAERFLFYDIPSENSLLWGDDVYQTAYQKQSDLGGRMLDAFEQIFSKGYKRVAIIGSDCYELNQSVIEHAFRILNKKDVVIGPAKDGGYYLLGLTKVIPQLFIDMEWSTENVFKTTTKRLDTLKLAYGTTEKLADVDTFDDLPQELKTLLDDF